MENNGVKFIGIETPIGSFNVWTKKIGNNPGIKILILHGGPGMTHEYLECFESFFPQSGFEMIEYDQLGSFYSDQPTDESLWTLPRFVDEVEQVRQKLNLNKDNFYLLGHSFGGMLAMHYAAKYRENIKGLIICNMMASFPEYNKYIGELRSRMPRLTVDRLEAYENKGLYKDAGYQALVTQEFHMKHWCRLPQFPEPVMRTLAHNNIAINEFALGQNPFKVSGSFMDLDISTELKNIKVPTLVVGAKYDIMDPEYLRWMSTQFPHGSYLYCENGSHTPMWDDQQTFMTGLINFINAIDKRN